MNIIRKYIKCAAIAAAAFMCSSACVSAADVNLLVNGKELQPEFPPFIENGYTYLAVRTMADIIGVADVAWDADARTVTLALDGTSVQLTIDSDHAVIDGAAVYTGVKPVIRNDRTYLPVRFIAETFGASVGWDNASKTVSVVYNSAVDAETELYWLSKIVYAEAGAEPYEGKLAVANVVLNRVKSNQFADTIEGVVFEKYNDIYQFTPVLNGYIFNNEPNSDSIAAAHDAVNGSNNIGECLYFVGADGAEESWVGNNREFYTQIGNHCFYR